MRAGKLRHRLTLTPMVEDTATASGELALVEDTDNAATVWGSIEPLSGRALEWAAAVNSEATHQVIIRAYSGLDTSYRIKFGSRVFEIESIQDFEERGIRQTIICKEKGV